MEPSIQYAKTKDGVNIAYWTLGKGMPLVHMLLGGYSHIQLEWDIPMLRRQYEGRAQKRMLVRYDGRGSGLSDRNVKGISLDTMLADLSAVVQRLDLDTFALFGFVDSGPAAIAYAARKPEQISHLILWCSYARGSEQEQAPEMPALNALADKDWHLFTETLAHTALGWSAGRAALRGAEFVRESTTPEVLQVAWRASGEFDVTALLPQVGSPTLVLCRPAIRWLTVELSRELAAGMPNAQLTTLDGVSGLPWTERTEPVLQAIEEFLGEGEEAEPAAPSELPEGMAVLLFADIAESTALTEQLGDAAFRAKARELDTSLRSVIRESGGTPVEGKVLGDGVLAVFTSARQAIDCALRCEAAGEPLGLRLHLGIHAGDVIREGNNVYGGAVNIAARIAAVSAPGEVLVSDTVRSLGRTSADVTFDDRGEHELKGVGEPQRLFAVRGGG